MPVAHLQMGAEGERAGGMRTVAAVYQMHKGGCQRKCFMST